MEEEKRGISSLENYAPIQGQSLLNHVRIREMWIFYPLSFFVISQFLLTAVMGILRMQVPLAIGLWLLIIVWPNV